MADRQRAGYWSKLRTLQADLAARRTLREEVIALGTPEREYQLILTMPEESDRLLDDLVDSLAAAAAAGEIPPDEAALHLPYWMMPWASGFALAEAVLADRAAVAGKRTLELGCGLGVTATAALIAGATLTANDCFDEALLYCRFNTLRNTGYAPETLLADWRQPAQHARLAGAGPFDLLLAADVLYDAEDVEPLLALLPSLVAPGGELWLAEPGRPSAERFAEQLRERGWPERYAAEERVWPAGAGHAHVALRRFRRV
jgi:predicted nicotinamide N-methyase